MRWGQSAGGIGATYFVHHTPPQRAIRMPSFVRDLGVCQQLHASELGFRRPEIGRLWC